jgi:hypothetical protein
MELFLDRFQWRIQVFSDEPSGYPGQVLFVAQDNMYGAM